MYRSLSLLLLFACFYFLSSADCPDSPKGFTGLQQVEYTNQASGSPYRWYINWCSGVNLPASVTGCVDADITAVGQVNKDLNTCYPTGTLEGTYTVNKDNIVLTYKPSSNGHFATITFTCDSKVSGIGAPTADPVQNGKEYLISSWPTNLACETKPPTPSDDGGSSDDKKGLSGGWIFIIIICALTPLYVVLGCVWNYKRNETRIGWDSCPQKAFWGALPGLFKDGCIFTCQGIKACIDKCRGRGYESV